MEDAPPVAAAGSSQSQCLSSARLEGSARRAPTSRLAAQASSAEGAAASSRGGRCCRCSPALGLQVANALQFLITAARLCSPRPLSAVSSLFLLCLGWKRKGSPSLLRLFFLAFFSLLFGVSDLFWVIVKCTGPYGLAWLQPKYYWRPLYAASLSHEAALGSSAAALAEASLDVQRRLLPPERPPAVWQIYCELAAFCLSPPVCFLGAWLAWRVYKRELAAFSADSEMLLPPLHALPPIYGSLASTEEVAEQQPVLGAPARCFVPFTGEGRRLGVERHEGAEETAASGAAVESAC